MQASKKGEKKEKRREWKGRQRKGKKPIKNVKKDFEVVGKAGKSQAGCKG